ncbi:glycoside hydrolase family 3 N-terminal domain-containing protein [Chryseolinea sp. T2]|uniref:glycoside hydrolase family 3 protein n=1 Tax=Chryseolinea sp. T2 TaxID=3129255 RepID=UPI003076F38F
MKKRILLLASALIYLNVYAQQPAVESPRAKAKKTLAGLSLERKVAQLLCVEISGDAAADDPRMKNWLSLAKDHGIGGFVIYGGTARNAAMVINKLQEAAAIPILISTDFEGGAGQQFKGATEFPPNMAFAATHSDDLMSKAAQVMAKEGRAIGIHLSYTPVVDVTLSADNPQESGRSFGGDLSLMNTMIKTYVSAYHKQGMLVTAKHFPGRGDMKGGPAYPSFTTLNKDITQLGKQEFNAFSHAVAAGVDFIMTEHIAVPSVSGNMQPASVEPKLVKGIIRDKLKFKGIITTDDLWYEHVVSRFGKDEVAVMAIEAGHDIVLKPKDPLTALKAITDAVKNGRIPLAQIDSSVIKLLVKKYAMGLGEKKIVEVDKLAGIVGTPENLKLVQEVADRSVTMLRNNNVLPLKAINPAKTVHITVQKIADQPNVEELKQTLSKSFEGIRQFSIVPGQDKKIYGEILKTASEAELVIISLFVQRERHVDPAPLSRELSSMLDGMSSAVPGKVVVMSFGNPYLINKLPHAPAFLVGYGEGGFYGNQTVYFNSLVSLLKGQLKPTGKLPVAISVEYPMGFGLQYKN